MGVCLQMLFSEGPGAVAVNLGGEPKGLVSSKVGDCSLEPRAGVAKHPWSLPAAAVSYLGVPTRWPHFVIWHVMGTGVSTWGTSALAHVALFLEMSKNMSWWLYEFPGAAVTNYYKFAGWKQHALFSHSSGDQAYKSKVWAGLRPPQRQ